MIRSAHGFSAGYNYNDEIEISRTSFKEDRECTDDSPNTGATEKTILQHLIVFEVERNYQ